MVRVWDLPVRLLHLALVAQRRPGGDDVVVRRLAPRRRLRRPRRADRARGLGRPRLAPRALRAFRRGAGPTWRYLRLAVRPRAAPRRPQPARRLDGGRRCSPASGRSHSPAGSTRPTASGAMTRSSECTRAGVVDRRAGVRPYRRRRDPSVRHRENLSSRWSTATSERHADRTSTDVPQRQKRRLTLKIACSSSENCFSPLYTRSTIRSARNTEKRESMRLSPAPSTSTNHLMERIKMATAKKAAKKAAPAKKAPAKKAASRRRRLRRRRRHPPRRSPPRSALRTRPS